jgi:hypothetical protein
MKIFKDGNLSNFAVAILLVIALVFMYIAITFQWPRYIFWGGFIILFIAHCSIQSSILHFRPFGESEWRKAKRTYAEESVPTKKNLEAKNPKESSIDLLALRQVLKLVILSIVIIFLVLCIGLLMKNMFNINFLSNAVK